jgi:hypothetical protein
MINESSGSENKNARRTLLASIGALSLFPLVKLGALAKKKEVISCAPTEEVQTVKMLTQDGTLVEVDISKLRGDKYKISNKQLQAWVKKEM